MLKSVPLDLLYICAELVTGKSIPVLVGLVRLPIGQGLAWVSVATGAVAGTCFSVWAERHTQRLTVLSFINRLLQLCFSLFLSISHLLSLAKGVYPQHGPALLLIPAFCIAWQPLPQRHSTALVSFLLSWATFYVCGIMTSIDAGVDTAAPTLEQAMQRQKLSHQAQGPVIVATLQQIVLRALQLFALGVYAAIQHAPTEVYFDSRSEWDSTRRPTYASHHHAKHSFYTLFMSLVSTWLRVSAWTIVCFSQENFLTLMLETTEIERSSFNWLCFAFYSVTLLYSATWTATQLREQILPCFIRTTDPPSSDLLRVFVLVFAFAAYYRQRPPELMFVLTHVLTAVSVLTALATLKRPDEKKEGETHRTPSRNHHGDTITTRARGKQ